MNYNKLLLDELRFVTYEKCDTELSDELLAKAVTLNENLQSLGYVLSPADVAAIAASPSLDGFYEKVKGMMDAVDAEPMYPGFPQQVIGKLCIALFISDKAEFIQQQFVIIHCFILRIKSKVKGKPFDDRCPCTTYMI